MGVERREVFGWLPIFDLTARNDFRFIANSGQSPHPIHSFGLTDRSYSSASSHRDLSCAARASCVPTCAGYLAPGAS